MTREWEIVLALFNMWSSEAYLSLFPGAFLLWVRALDGKLWKVKTLGLVLLVSVPFGLIAPLLYLGASFGWLRLFIYPLLQQFAVQLNHNIVGTLEFAQKDFSVKSMQRWGSGPTTVQTAVVDTKRAHS